MRKQKSLPEGLSEIIIKDAYQKELDRYSSRLIEEIKVFLKKPLNPGINNATVEIFADEYGDGHASIGLYLRGKGTTHIAFAEYANDLPLIDVQWYSENDIEVPDILVDLVKYWFAESWFKAGGWDFPIPITMYGHDGFGDGKVVDLTSKS